MGRDSKYCNKKTIKIDNKNQRLERESCSNKS